MGIQLGAIETNKRIIDKHLSKKILSDNEYGISGANNYIMQGQVGKD